MRLLQNKDSHACNLILHSECSVEKKDGHAWELDHLYANICKMLTQYNMFARGKATKDLKYSTCTRVHRDHKRATPISHEMTSLLRFIEYDGHLLIHDLFSVDRNLGALERASLFTTWPGLWRVSNT